MGWGQRGSVQEVSSCPTHTNPSSNPSITTKSKQTEKPSYGIPPGECCLNTVYKVCTLLEHEGTHQGSQFLRRRWQKVCKASQASLGCIPLNTLPQKDNKTAYTNTEMNEGVTKPYPHGPHITVGRQQTRTSHSTSHADRCCGESTEGKGGEEGRVRRALHGQSQHSKAPHATECGP